MQKRLKILCAKICVKSYITLHSGILIKRESYLNRSDDADFFQIVKATSITNTQSCPSLSVCLENLGQHIFLGSGLPITGPFSPPLPPLRDSAFPTLLFHLCLNHLKRHKVAPKCIWTTSKIKNSPTKNKTLEM